MLDVHAGISTIAGGVILTQSASISAAVAVDIS